MRRVVAGIAAALLLGFAGPAVAQTIGDEIQNEEQPGSVNPNQPGRRRGSGGARERRTDFSAGVV